MSQAGSAPRWVFDDLPPSGARRGGNPAEHAFRPDLDSFVREIVQNANDQRVGAPEVHFRLSVLKNEALTAFLEACSWETLEPHLVAAARERGGRGIGRALSDLRSNGRLVVLHVEDRHTVGLTGEESEGDSHFRALCKDTLYSHKRSAAAGGSYGLGKSVLWTFSGLSTVLFASVLKHHPRGKRSPRLIGRAELPSHVVGKREHSGSGWFGEEIRVGRGMRRAESVWGLGAAVQARLLHLDRAPVSGTSILVVGFRDPASDVEADVDSLEREIRAACANWFWPALAMARQPLRIVVGDHPVAPRESESLAPFLDCWQQRHNPSQRLQEPGDVVRREVEIDLPSRRDGGAGGRVQCTLLVRLADERKRDARTGRVATFRGPGMVVRYWDKSSLATARPFHAVLACGEARDPEHSSEADRALDRFLRDAEPPGHDDWISTPALKEGWKRGYAKALELLRDRVAVELRDALSPRSSLGSRGPEQLARRFPIGSGGGRGGGASAFRFSGLRAVVADSAWRFSGALRTTHPERPWRAEVRLSEVGDDGSELASLGVAAASIGTLGVSGIVSDGVLTLHAPAGVDEATFSGTSEPIGDELDGRCELRMDVVGYSVDG
ncbi:MAG: hypothetical protein IT379_13965 [Deltaproteobacteria bacterium]|nr:hypothetical protein [Deltaproteobacteria bacterium]